MQATAEIKKGDQVFISYGNRSDDEMIADYGFCLGLDDSARGRICLSKSGNKILCHSKEA